MTNEIVGPLSHLVLYAETTWGTKPGSPARIFLPVTEYGVEFAAEARQGNPFTGLFQRKHNRRFKGMPSGSLSCPLYGYFNQSASLAQHIIDWSFGVGVEESPWLASKGAEWAEGPDTANRQHNGLRVNQATIQGSADSGIVEITADLMGKDEVVLANATALPNDMDKLVDFEFADVIFTLDSVATEIEGFALTVSNGLKPRYLNSRTPSILPKTQRILTYQFTLVKNSDTYQAAARLLTSDQEYDVQLLLKGLHNGSGGSGDYSQVIFDLPRCSLVNPDDARAIEDLTMTTINTQVLKPDDTQLDLTATWSTVS